jgi:ferrochelatase
MKTAVLLMAHGTPDSLDEIEPYLRHVMTRRPPTPEFAAQVRERYRLIGGRSPLTDITQAQAAALSARLGVPAYVGMRHWKPWIGDAVAQAQRDGIERLVGVCAAPHYAAVSVGAYHAALQKAVPSGMRTVLVASWHGEPALIEAWRARLRGAGTILYTAHSIPVEGSDPYPAQIRETIREIGLPGELAYQSRSPSPVPWLEPDVDTALSRLRDRGVLEVRVAPIGFVSDHVEVLYDIDILHRATAERLGMAYSRTRMLNDDPRLIEALASAVTRALASA